MASACRKAIMSGREVWRVLLKHDIGVDDIATAVKRMDRFELVADEAYRSMLERHPNQPRLLTVSARRVAADRCRQPRKPKYSM